MYGKKVMNSIASSSQMVADQQLLNGILLEQDNLTYMMGQSAHRLTQVQGGKIVTITLL